MYSPLAVKDSYERFDHVMIVAEAPSVEKRRDDRDHNNDPDSRRSMPGGGPRKEEEGNIDEERAAGTEEGAGSSLDSLSTESSTTSSMEESTNVVRQGEKGGDASRGRVRVEVDTLGSRRSAHKGTDIIGFVDLDQVRINT